jgi:molybdate transport system substrate-binding protein
MNVRKHSWIGFLALCVCIAFAVGCNKEESTPTPVGRPGGLGAGGGGGGGAPTGDGVQVVAYYPGNPGHDYIKEILAGIQEEFGDDVSTRFVDFTSDEGSKEWAEAGLSCGSILVNGQQQFDFERDGEQVSVYFAMGEGGEWTRDDLKAVVAMAVEKGATAPDTPEEDEDAAVVDIPEGGLTGEIEVLVPCGLDGPYGKARLLFKEQNPGLKITQDPQNIDVLVNGIESGKFEGDLFLSLGDREIEHLQGAGKIDGEPVSFAGNSIAVLVPTDNPAGLEGFEDLTGPEVKVLVIGDPDALSVGYYAAQALRNAEMWDSLEDRILMRKQPAMMKQDVGGHKAEAAIIFGTCLAETKEVGGEPTAPKKAKGLAAVPQEYYDEFDCVGAVLTSAKNPEAARAFLEFLTTSEVQEIFAEFGFRAL